MEYQFYPITNEKLHITERYSNSTTAYYSKKKIKEIYPTGNYKVIGEIGNSSKRYENQDIIITDTGRVIPIFPRGSLKKPFEWIKGYAPVGDNIYVSVVKSIIPQWIVNLCGKKV